MERNNKKIQMQDKTGNGEGKLNEVKQVWKKEEWIEWKPKGMNIYVYCM
jgi:hypothetical protein